MNGPMDSLRYGLADLAEEVRPVDLRKRVLRTSRRLAVRRAIMTSTAAVAVLAAGSGIALAVLPQRGTTPPVVTGTTPTPSLDASPSTPPSASPSVPAAVDSAKILPGRLYYYQNGLPAQVHAWDGGTVTKVLEPADTTWFTQRVSPDGLRMAWVSDSGQLYVANADGSGVRKVRDNVRPGCFTPVWTADSRRVIATQPRPVGGGSSVDELGYVDVASGNFQPLGIPGCHPTMAPGDDYLAYADGSTGKVSVARPDGTASRTVPVLGSEDPQVNPQRARTFDIHSLSPDGNLLVCRLRTGNQPSGDAALDPYANAVIDTRTGKQVALPITGQLINAVFLADGSLLARLQGATRNELVLISKDLKTVLDRIDEPADLKDRPLLAYTPA